MLPQESSLYDLLMQLQNAPSQSGPSQIERLMRVQQTPTARMLPENLSSVPLADISQGEGGALMAALARRKAAEQRGMAGFPSMNPNPPEMAGLRPMGRFEAADNPQLQMSRENTPEARRARELVQLEQRRAEMRAGDNRSGTKYVPGAKVGKSVVGRMGEGQIALQGTLTPEAMAAALQGRANLRAADKAFREDRKMRIAERKAATNPGATSLEGLVRSAMQQGATFAEAMQVAQAQLAVPEQQAARKLEERKMALMEGSAASADRFRNTAEEQRQREFQAEQGLKATALQAQLAEIQREVNRDKSQQTAAEAEAEYKRKLVESEMAGRVVPLIKQKIPGSDMTLDMALRPGTIAAVMTPDGGIDQLKLDALFQNDKLTPEEVGRLKQFGVVPQRSTLQRALGRMPGEQFGAYDAAEYGSMFVPGLWPLKASLEYSRPIRDALGIPLLN